MAIDLQNSAGLEPAELDDDLLIATSVRIEAAYGFKEPPTVPLTLRSSGFD